MKNEIKKIIDLTNKYIVLATPLILFSLFSNIYAMISASGKLINIIIAISLLTLMTGAFIAGWFSMVKNAVADEYPQNPNALIKDFIPGVGEFFMPATAATVLISTFSFIMLILSFIIGFKAIGNVGISAEQFANAMVSTEALKSFISSLSAEQIIKINQWNILLITTLTLSYFLMVFYIPSLFYKSKNPFIAFGIGIKDLFSKKFFFALFYTLAALIIYLFLSILSTLTANVFIIHFAITLINFYFLLFIAISLFYFYRKYFVLSHLGQNIDEIV